MIGNRRAGPIEGDTNRWYITGRNQDFTDRFALTQAEFCAISPLVPLVTQIKGDRYEVTCVNRQDARDVHMMLAAITSHAFHDKRS